MAATLAPRTSARSSSFYGWRVVGASCIGLAVCQSPVAFLTLGIFMRPLSEAFGWGRGDIALALSIGALTIALVMPVAGRLTDRLGARRVILPSMLGFGILMGSLSLLTPSLWHFYAMFVLIGVVGSGANNTAYVRVITAWFVKSRGLALGLATAGVGIGAAVAPIIAQATIETYGWRAAYVALGLLVLAIGLPIVTVFIRDRPADLGLTAYGQADVAPVETDAACQRVETGISASEALRSRVFWTLTASAFTFCFAIHGLQVHLVPLFIDSGIPAERAAVLTSAIGVLSVAARIVSGRLFDITFAPRIGVMLCLCGIVALVLLPLVRAHPIVAVPVVVLIGGGAGAESDLLAYLASRYFGLQSLGVLYGYVFCAVMLGTASGPYVYGLMYDAQGSYHGVLWVAIGMMLASTLLLLSMPRFPVFAATPDHDH